MKNGLRNFLVGLLSTLFGRKRLLFLLSEKHERALLGFENSGYLQQTGWVNSVKTGSISDAEGKPLPWVTYPFIAFIEIRLNKSHDVFEFGSGNSTHWYAARANTVTSVEHDEDWYQKVKKEVGDNVQLNFCALTRGGEYANFVAGKPAKYDIIIVDGRDRVNCCINSINALKADGVMVLDDSEREEYLPAHELFAAQGFKKIEFWGMAPLVDYKKCTTIFYHANNCLGI